MSLSKVQDYSYSKAITNINKESQSDGSAFLLEFSSLLLLPSGSFHSFLWIPAAQSQQRQPIYLTN